MKNLNKLTEQEKQNTITFYNRMYVESLERLATKVSEGESTPRNTASQILEITTALRELNSL